MFRYYVVFAFISDQGQLLITCRYMTRNTAIETAMDIEALVEDANFGDFKGITVLNWKRIS